MQGERLFLDGDTCENGAMRDEDSLAEPPLRRSPEDLKEGEDYYYDGPYLVFTARYHLKRGTCCNSGCRHCPYQDFTSPA